MRHSTRTKLLIASLSFVVSCVQSSDAPELSRTDKESTTEYYQDILGLSDADPNTLRGELHVLIDNHQSFPYSSNSWTDTWDILEEAQALPNDPESIVDIYRNKVFPIGGWNKPYNREHVWPKSYGFPASDGYSDPHNDCHALFLSDAGYNSARSNKPYRNCNTNCTAKPTVNGSPNLLGINGWETWQGRRGDVARAIFYMDLRYEGGEEDDSWEPNLVVTNNPSLIKSSSKHKNVAYMGLLATLLEWHQEDPVDDWERQHNEVVYQYQGNRNPFVDHPNWVECIYQGSC